MIEPPAQPPTYAHLFGRLLRDGEDFARAKLKVYQQLAMLRASQARLSLILGLAGVLILLAATIVLLTGLMFALAVKVGFLWSALIVFAACLILGVVLLTLAKGALPDFDRDPLDEPIVLPEDPVI